MKNSIKSPTSSARRCSSILMEMRRSMKPSSIWPIKVICSTGKEISEIFYTGDPSAAARYIETRLSPLARETLFNPDITEKIPSYDGRNLEPVTLPAKIPLLLMQGADGIAVGMATRILPHNFTELLEAEIAYLEGRDFQDLSRLPHRRDHGQKRIRQRARQSQTARENRDQRPQNARHPRNLLRNDDRKPDPLDRRSGQKRENQNRGDQRLHSQRCRDRDQTPPRTICRRDPRCSLRIYRMRSVPDLADHRDQRRPSLGNRCP